MTSKRGKTLRERAIGLLVCLGILIQPLLVPLHLFMVEHCYDHQDGSSTSSLANPAAAGHEQAHARGLAHAHASHVHVNKQADDHRHWPHEILNVAAGETDDSHPLHPSEEHCYELAKLFTAASVQLQPLAAGPAPSGLAPVFLPTASTWNLAPCPVEQSPLPGSVRPRAPPRIV